MSKTCNYPIMSSRRDNVYFLLDKSVGSVCSMNFNFAYVHMSCLYEKIWFTLINTVPAEILFQNLRIPEEEKISVKTPVKILIFFTKNIYIYFCFQNYVFKYYTCAFWLWFSQLLKNRSKHTFLINFLR